MAGFTASGQTNYNPNGTEYAIVGSLPGDQVFPDVALNSSGGFVVWQDNVTDGSGWGISACQVNGTLSSTLSPFRINVNAVGNEEHARVALLKGGGAAFTWQGGPESLQHIYARFLTASNTFQTTTDIMVNPSANYYQSSPAVAVLNNSNVVVVWQSLNEAGSNTLDDVYGQLFTAAGQKIGGEFLVNQDTNFNQRSPAVAALATGGFAVAWVSEQERIQAVLLSTNSSSSLSLTNGIVQNASVDIYARMYNSAGTPSGGEILVNADNNSCASPSIAGASDGSFLIAWTERGTVVLTNGWDIYACSCSSSGSPGSTFLVNSYRFGDQYAPRVSAIGSDYMVVWTSLGEDSSREGVYGQYVHEGGTLNGGQFLVNTTTLGSQMQPAVASDGAAQFLVVWTSFTGLASGLDLFAQRYVNGEDLLIAMPAPFLWVPFTLSNNIYQPQIVVSWSALAGLSVSNYEIYVDGATSPTVLVSFSTNQWTMTAANKLSTNGIHSFQIDYVLNNGNRSPISPSANATTWSGRTWGGIPYEWMAKYFPYSTNLWPSASAQLAPGLSLFDVFLSGGNPQDPSTWLETQFTKTPEGMFVSWNTQPGATYQVQSTTNLVTWINLGAPRFAAGTSDSINVGNNTAGFYRVLLMR